MSKEKIQSSIYDLSQFCHRHGQCGRAPHVHFQQETTHNEQSVHNESGDSRFFDWTGVNELLHNLLGVWRVDIWADCMRQ